jgi:ABC-type multidrug transport system ATPase subunit
MHEGSMIEALTLTKVYGGKAAVDGIDFQVRPGMVTGFLGPNGAGKPVTGLRLSLPRRSRRTAAW